MEDRTVTDHDPDFPDADVDPVLKRIADAEKGTTIATPEGVVMVEQRHVEAWYPTVADEIDHQWTDTELDDNTPGAWLDGPSLRVGTTLIHLYAVRVRDGEDGMQEATDAPMEQELDNVLTLTGSRAETTTIDGFDGEYVVYAIPTGD